MFLLPYSSQIRQFNPTLAIDVPSKEIILPLPQKSNLVAEEALLAVICIFLIHLFGSALLFTIANKHEKA